MIRVISCLSLLANRHPKKIFCLVTRDMNFSQFPKIKSNTKLTNKSQAFDKVHLISTYVKYKRFLIFVENNTFDAFCVGGGISIIL